MSMCKSKQFFLPPFPGLLMRGSHIGIGILASDMGLVCSTESLTQQPRGSIWWDINQWLWISWQRSCVGHLLPGLQFSEVPKTNYRTTIRPMIFFETPEPEHLMDTHIASIDRETYDNLHQDLHLTSCDTCVVPFWFMVKAMTEDSTCDRDMRAHQTMCVKRSLSYIL